MARLFRLVGSFSRAPASRSPAPRSYITAIGGHELDHAALRQ